MATFIGTCSFAHNSDEDFRAWATFIRDSLVNTGGGIISQTDDTGQMDFATAPRPGSNIRVYFMLKMDDGLGPAIFIRVEVGTGPATNYIAMLFSFGTGTNGAGGLTGAVRNGTLNSQSTVSNNPASPSYVCVLPGYICAAFGNEFAGGRAAYQVCLSRHQDDSGEPNDTGYHVVLSMTTLSSASAGLGTMGINFDGSSAYSNGSGFFCLALASQTDFSFNGKIQPMPVWYRSDRFRVSSHLCLVPIQNVALDSELTTRILGAEPRTYRNIKFRAGTDLPSTVSYTLLVLWE